MKKLLTVFIINMLFVFSACLVDEDIKIDFETYVPEQLKDGWEISTPGAEGFDPVKIDQIYAKLFSEELFPTARSMLIVRKGKLVAEGYCRDKNDRDRFHNLQSATKSFTAILTGIALDKGLIGEVDDLLFSYIPGYFDADPQKQQITIAHTLTMQTGLQFDNDVNTVELYNWPGSSLEFVLSRDLVSSPGTTFYYHDGNPQLISGLIQQVSGKTMEDFAREYLFAPLEITNYQWEKAADGISFGAFGLWLTPRDMAKVGRLLAQGGNWNGEQLVSADWISESTRVHANGNYGYYFWVQPETNSMLILGHGEQIIYINTNKDLVVVMTADPYESGGTLIQGIRGLIAEVVQAVIL